MSSNPFGFKHKEASWIVLYAQHTILSRLGVCADSSEIVFFIYQPSRHVATSANLLGSFKGTGRIYEIKKNKTAMQPSFCLPDLIDVLK